MTDPLTPIGPNVSASDNSGLVSPLNRATFNTTTMRELSEAVTQPPDPGSVNRRWGIIAGIHGAPDYTVDVTIGGVISPGLAYDAAYIPTLGEVVMLDIVGTDTVVIGTTAPAYWRTGSIEPSFLPAPKPGTVLCNGQALSRTTYANLWSWVTANGLSGTGKPFGNGDGSTTFTVPDLRGRVAIGAGTLGTDTYNVGDMPGAARQTLTTAQMPSHNHSVSATATTSVTNAAHTHSFSATSGSTSHTHGGTSDGVGDHQHVDSAVVIVPGANQGNGTSYGSDTQDAHWNNMSNATGLDSYGAGTRRSGLSGNHSHTFTTASNSHTHSVSGTSGSTTPTSTATTNVSVSQSTVGGTTPVDVRQPAFVVNWLLWT